MRRSSDPEPPAAILPHAIRTLGRRAGRLYRMHDAFRHLPELIGASFARHIIPVSISQGRLFLYVPNDAWRSEAWMYRTEIMRRINEHMGEDAVREVVFTRNRPARAAGGCEAETAAPRRRLAQVNLTDDELAHLRRRCSDIRDEKLRSRLLSLSIRQKQLEKMRREEKWHPCPTCGIPCEPERAQCATCARLERGRIRGEIRALLREAPWLRPGEIAKYIPASTPQTVASVRADLVQQIAARVHLEEWASDEARMLVMLYLCLPPAQLSDDTVRRTLWRLRGDLAQPEKFRPVKRYDIIPLGRAERANSTNKRRGRDVSAHRRGRARPTS